MHKGRLEEMKTKCILIFINQGFIQWGIYPRHEFGTNFFLAETLLTGAQSV
jgi:hypothetical protein